MVRPTTDLEPFKDFVIERYHQKVSISEISQLLQAKFNITVTLAQLYRYTPILDGV